MRKFWLSSFVSLNWGKNLSNVVELPKRMVTRVTISLGYITDQTQDLCQCDWNLQQGLKSKGGIFSNICGLYNINPSRAIYVANMEVSLFVVNKKWTKKCRSLWARETNSFNLPSSSFPETELFHQSSKTFYFWFSKTLTFLSILCC